MHGASMCLAGGDTGCLLPPVYSTLMYDPYFKRRAKAAAKRERGMASVDFSLPVDGDVPAFRTPSACAGDMLDSIVADLTRDRSPVFDEVCAKWKKLFPDLAAKPGKWVAGASGSIGGRLFLHVGSASASFALRPRLASIRKRLATLASAPPRFSVHIEIV